jgi:hypothetical protein
MHEMPIAVQPPSMLTQPPAWMAYAFSSSGDHIWRSVVREKEEEQEVGESKEGQKDQISFGCGFTSIGRRKLDVCAIVWDSASGGA